MIAVYCLINPAGEVACRRAHDPDNAVWNIDPGWRIAPETECAGLPDAPPPPPKAVPVTPRQLRLWLHAQGLLTAVEAAIDGMPDGQRAAVRIEWDYATEYRPKNPVVAGLAAALGLSAGQTAAAFAAASIL